MRHELLSPAGSPEIFRAVIAAGADAVYLGGEKFGARAYAANFSGSEILDALDYAHLHGRRVFLTVNTLLKNREIGRELFDYLEPYYRNGLDAIIVQDYGVFQFVRKYFPDLPVHISTQMSVVSAYGARFLKEQGASRIVTARELSLAEIRHIYDETGMEIESFIHGALCYCYSGQCLMSSLLGGRSGNRGRCAQPCRLGYQVTDARGKYFHKKEKYPLSPKDLCALHLLPKLCRAGVYSFKIEGRMKQLDYAAGVTEIYRKYLDLYEEHPADFSVEPADIDRLLSLGSRNGFTDGYYERRNGREMMTFRDSSHSRKPDVSGYVIPELPRLPVAGHAVCRIGERCRLELTFKEEMAREQRPRLPQENIKTAVHGQIVDAAINRPLAKEELVRQLKKTGDSPFIFDSLTAEMDKGAFLTVKAVNELRREGLEILRQEFLKPYRRTCENSRDRETDQAVGSREAICAALSGNKKSLPAGETKKESFFPAAQGTPTLNVQICSKRMLTEVLAHPFVDMVSLDLPPAEALRCAEDVRAAGKRCGFFLPHILRDEEAKTMFAAFRERGNIQELFDFIFARSYDGLKFAETVLGFPRGQIVPDLHLYVFSAYSAEAFARLGYPRYTVSPELNSKELRHMPNGGGEFLIYGYLPLMISAQCVYKNYDRCQKGLNSRSDLFLQDRYFKKFFIKKCCEFCYNILYNSQPLFLLHQSEEIRSLGFGFYRIAFVREDDRRIRETLSYYSRAFVERKKIPAPDWKDGFTNGHFRRGVE